MGRLIDLTGRHFGRLTVIERAGTYRPKNNPYSSDPLWRCLCDPELGGCGRETFVIGSNLRYGHTVSCGCLRDEKAKERLRVIGKGRKQ